MTARRFVYVSNAADGTIGAYAMDAATGTLAAIATVEAGANVMPMAVSPDRRHLYAAIRSAPWRVVTFAIDQTTGDLSEVAEAPLPDSLCSLAVDATGRWLLGASYGGNIACVSAIDADGRVLQPSHQVVATGTHAHAIVTDKANAHVFVPCLGSDEVMQYRFDATGGKLTAQAPASVKSATGDGPRHMRFSPDNRFAYVLGELTGNVIQHAVAADGTLTPVGVVSSVPREAGLGPGAPRGPGTPESPVPVVWCADLQITPDGRFLYATERTTSKIALLTVAPATGAPALVGTFATETQPRGIAISSHGRFLVGSGEKSDRLIVYAIDAASGSLTTVCRTPGGRGANWVEIVDLA